MATKKVDARGAATRDRLVVAALDLFGRRGFEGVGAREIAAAANAPLAAIPYHFGTKEALYRAVLERVAERLRAAMAPAAAAVLPALTGTPSQAWQGLHDLQAALVYVFAAEPEAEGWAKLLLREHFDPSSAFDVVYDDAARGALELLATLIGRATGRAPDEEAVLIEAFARLGQVLVFRTIQPAVRRRLEWPLLGQEQAEKIVAVLHRINDRPVASD